MKRATIWLGLVALMGSLMAPLACPREAGAQDAVEIKLGAFMPISGISADVGAQIRAGIEVAVERAHQQGLRLGAKPARVRVIWYDTEGKGDVGLNVVTRALTIDKIHIGIGFLSSDVFLRVMDEFQKAATPAIACCATSMKIRGKIAENKMGYVFQLSPRLIDLVASLSAAVATNVKPQKVAFLNENTDVGRSIPPLARAWFAANAKGVEFVADEYVERGVTDLTPQLAKFKRSGAQVIFGEIYGSSAPILYNQWYELKVPAVIVHGGTTAGAQDFIDRHQKVMEGSLLQERWWPARYSEVSEPMMAAYKKKTGVDPTHFAVQAHDAALVAIEGSAKAGSLEPDRIRESLEHTTFVTAWGTRGFTPLADGHGMPIEAGVVQVQGGKKVPIYPPALVARVGGRFIPLPPFAWEKK
jgi:branched-chain amino acid transport system substrate-binding protein